MYSVQQETGSTRKTAVTYDAAARLQTMATAAQVLLVHISTIWVLTGVPYGTVTHENRQ
jgi:hypothetical protein